MRCVTYAGETVTTTDDVAEALVKLTASLAAAGLAEAVGIPIVLEDGSVEEAELVIGVGNDVLSAPAHGSPDELDFSAAADELRRHAHYPRTLAVAHAPAGADEGSDAYYDPDLEAYLNA